MIDQGPDQVGGFGPVGGVCGADGFGQFGHRALVIVKGIGVDFDHRAVIGIAQFAFNLRQIIFQFGKLVHKCC
ncbi:hypothetical protein [Thalassospira sp. MCCC 1A02898]|uniref:hypothetical protein n=1 Tax=Thalassospira sp. MCCC 1A02898 TaxID=501868 RepID=UPI001E338283|nr:hypothetical protein [Thalassospira sp. MCCC 1A02898]